MALRWIRRGSILTRIPVVKIITLSMLAAVVLFYYNSVITVRDTQAETVVVQAQTQNDPDDPEINIDSRSRSRSSTYVKINHHDWTGEWFERPMVLREPNVTSVLRKSLTVPSLNLISIDFKIGPIFAIKHVLQQYGVNLIDKSMSSYCHVTNTCSNYRIGKSNDGLLLTRDDITRFWKQHKKDIDFLDADGFICIHPVSLCELVLPFDKPVIMIIGDRYEYGRTKKTQWLKWNKVFKAIAMNSDNIVLTTNPYDKEYVFHFTQTTLPVVPYACEYVTQRYDPRKPSYLLMPIKREGFQIDIVDRFRSEIKSHNMRGRLDYVIDLYGDGYTTNELRRHAGLVVIPHQVSFLAMTELMRLNMPVFMPSVELLARWQVDTHLMDLSIHHYGTKNREEKGSSIDGADGLPDPNEDQPWAVGFWLTFSEYFSWLGLKYFDSIEDLASKINATTGEDLYYTSQRAKAFNEQDIYHIKQFWEDAIDKLKKVKVKKSILESE